MVLQVILVRDENQFVIKLAAIVNESCLTSCQISLHIHIPMLGFYIIK